LPHATIAKPTEIKHFKSWEEEARGLPVFQTNYDEGLKVGYKWYDAEKKPVLFPFGYGLSYTTFSYSNLKVTQGKNVHATFTVANTGSRAGAEIAEVYATLPASAGEPPKRLVGWSKVKLGAGESKEVSVEIDSEYLSIFDVDRDTWLLPPGDYTLMVGGSSQNLPLKGSLKF
jgi:beta-glucosidase